MFIGNQNNEFPPVGRYMLYPVYNAMSCDQIKELLDFYGVETPRHIANNAEELLNRLSAHLNVASITLR